MVCRVALVLFAASLVIARADDLSIDRVMTPHDREITGVASLTPAQRQALNDWLRTYTSDVMRFVVDLAASPKAVREPAYDGGSFGHWIEPADEDSRALLLEDGSVWQIRAADQAKSARWGPAAPVVILRADAPEGEYRYTLLNKGDGSKVLARYLGRR